MKCVFSIQKLARRFSCAVVALGMLAGSALAVRADAPCYAPYCPQYCPQGTGVDGQGMSPTPADPNAPAAQPNANQDLNLAPQGDSALAQSLSGDGANVGHIGRADNLNRLNIFDSQAATPMNRVWMGFQYLDNFTYSTVGLGTTGSATQYRIGGEVLLTESGMNSISVQGQYADATQPGFNAFDGVSNPQIMAKQIIYRDCDLTLSGTFGIQIPVGTNANTAFRETGTRLAPGLLWYYNTGEDLFNYGGFQWSISTNTIGVDTLDWSFGTGYWLYRSCCCCDTVQSVSLQYEVFGKHVVGDNHQSYLLGSVQEASTVVDMTFGASVFVRNGMRVSGGYAIPVTSGYARRNELTITVGYYF